MLRCQPRKLPGGLGLPVALLESKVISVKEVEHVAKLARLALSEEEAALYSRQLSKIISYFDELQQLDTTDVEPLSHAQSLSNVLRPDQVLAPPGRQVLLQNAPCQENGYFRVPKISE